MRESLTRSMAAATGLPSDGRHELWKKKPRKCGTQGDFEYEAFDSVQLYLRRIGGVQYLVLKPSIKVLGKAGDEAPLEIANPVKLGILGYQHNKQFNKAVNGWREELFPRGQEACFEFPRNCGSTFKFKVRRTPVFGEIGLPQGGPPAKLTGKVQQLIRYSGIQLTEPELLFSNKTGTGLAVSPHPIRGIADNYPYDYPLTVRGFLGALRLGIICPAGEARELRDYLQNVNRRQSPSQNERDYLVDYPGFQAAYGLPIQLPESGETGMVRVPRAVVTGSSNSCARTRRQHHPGD
jgi:hypothetical protein